MAYTPLEEAIAVWTAKLERYRIEVNAGLLREDAACIAYATARLRDLQDIDGDIPPEAA